ncbi:uncharacterized protein PpBr36_11087 [Pyricularia pennisetigena]|uniref:uncharacterized protein n=1 Tax=Pyricularia pennisetigena TaxID=1578925 RepID=UPI0011544FCA|nr:uncharacterized protein PpBr36_11087 [Pyricularia pennisetigena]TLS20643.1 hypothetical protein PpBr36_11087 [Pyricularia pennisetigena]
MRIGMCSPAVRDNRCEITITPVLADPRADLDLYKKTDATDEKCYSGPDSDAKVQLEMSKLLFTKKGIKFTDDPEMGILDDENARIQSIEAAIRDSNIINEDAAEKDNGEDGGIEESDYDKSEDEDDSRDDEKTAVGPKPKDSPAKPKTPTKTSSPSRPVVKSKFQELKEKNAAKTARSASVPLSANASKQWMGTYIVGSKNIGSNANKPKWTREDLDKIPPACATKLPIIIVNETRHNKLDVARPYSEMGPEGTTVATIYLMLPNLDLFAIKIGSGKARVNEKLQKGKCYPEVVYFDAENDWIVNQWTVMNMLMEPVDEKILNRPTRIINGRPERKIGESFARFGLPTFLQRQATAVS